MHSPRQTMRGVRHADDLTQCMGEDMGGREVLQQKTVEKSKASESA
jgi:hypothetical protein